MTFEAETTVSLGSPASAFSLPDVVTGKNVSLQDLSPSKALLIIFLCRHCPHVIHVRKALLDLVRQYQPAGLACISICSNDAIKYPDDAPDKLREMAIECKFPFPLLYDESQAVARAYGARCTPDFFLYDAQHRLAYRGRFDDSTPGNGKPVTGNDLRAAMEQLLAGKPVSLDQKPGMGCSIKWK